GSLKGFRLALPMKASLLCGLAFAFYANLLVVPLSFPAVLGTVNGNLARSGSAMNGNGLFELWMRPSTLLKKANRRTHFIGLGIVWGICLDSKIVTVHRSVHMPVPV